MSKIYIITQGSYSDYHICAATTDKDKAEMLKKLYTEKNSSVPPEIEEYDDGAYAIDMFDKGYKAYRVDVSKDSNKEPHVQDITPPYVTGEDDEWQFNFYDSFKEGLKEYYTFFQSYSYAKSTEEAKKIAYDRIAQYKAEKEGIA